MDINTEVHNWSTYKESETMDFSALNETSVPYLLSLRPQEVPQKKSFREALDRQHSGVIPVNSQQL